MALSEYELVKRFGEHEPMLRAFIVSQLPQGIRRLIDVDDIIQETYSDAWKHIGDFRGGSLPAWLNIVAKRNIIDRIRSLNTRRRGGDVRTWRLGMGNDSASSGIAVASPQESPSKGAVAAENRRHLERCIAKLSPRYQLVITRSFFDHRSDQELADELQISKKAVQMLLKRATDKLRDKLLSKVRKLTTG